MDKEAELWLKMEAARVSELKKECRKRDLGKTRAQFIRAYQETIQIIPISSN